MIATRKLLWRSLPCAGVVLLGSVPAFAQAPVLNPSGTGSALAAPSPPAMTPAFAKATADKPQADAQQVREELDRLRKEFEAIRDSYGARLAALEAKLGSGPPSAAPLPGAAPPQAPVSAPAGVEVPAGAAGAGGPQGSLPVYGGGSALSKIFNPDIAVIGNFLGAAGENTIEPAPRARAGRGGG